jgi:formate transporter
MFSFDAFAPREIAERVETVGVAKARLAFVPMAMLGVCAGAFIGLGALAATIVFADASLGFAAQRLLGGLVFALGLILVVVAGAELFTGNNLMAMAWADGRLTTREVVANWVVVCAANCVGAVGLAALVAASGHAGLNGGGIGAATIKIAAAKCQLDFVTAFLRAVLCNLLVCMAVWMAMAGRSVVDKVVVIVPPIAIFVAAGFRALDRQHVFHSARLDAGDFRPGLRGRAGGGGGDDRRLPRQRDPGDPRQSGRRQRAGGAGLLPDLPAAGEVRREDRAMLTTLRILLLAALASPAPAQAGRRGRRRTGRISGGSLGVAAERRAQRSAPRPRRRRDALGAIPHDGAGHPQSGAPRRALLRAMGERPARRSANGGQRSRWCKIEYRGVTGWVGRARFAASDGRSAAPIGVDRADSDPDDLTIRLSMADAARLVDRARLEVRSCAFWPPPSPDS